MSNLVERAFNQVKSHCPTVKSVEYDREGRWLYKDADGKAVAFNNRINFALLEDAAASVRDVPCKFTF